MYCCMEKVKCLQRNLNVINLFLPVWKERRNTNTFCILNTKRCMHVTHIIVHTQLLFHNATVYWDKKSDKTPMRYNMIMLLKTMLHA